MINNMKTILSAVKQYVEGGLKKSIPDWNENNPDSINYIKNRTHGVEYKEAYLIPQQTVTIDEDGGYIEFDQSLYLTEGETYTVVFNGVTYKCIAWNNGEDTILIGNGDIYGGEGMGDTNMPFSCDSYDDGTIYINVAEAGTYTISISGIQEVITKIDEKFLPASIGKSGTNEGAEIFNDYSGNVAEGDFSHAEGQRTTASGYSSHAEGDTTIASGERSHAEGYQTTASGEYSHTEGQSTTASNAGTHAEGRDTTASGLYSHAEGWYTTASGQYGSHAEGDTTTASGQSSHAEGQGYQRSLYLTGNANSTSYKVSSNNSNIKIGRVLKYNDTYAKITNYNSSTLTITTDTTLSSTALSNATVKLLVGVAYGNYSHSEGYYTMAFGDSSHSEGSNTTASGEVSHTEGSWTMASGDFSHAEGYGSRALNDSTATHASFNNVSESGYSAHAEGYYTTANGTAAHAEGYGVLAKGDYSHAEGYKTTASDSAAHAEGYYTTASGSHSHAEGNYTTASGDFSHAEGVYTTASGNYSHAEGYKTIANGQYSNVIGTYNIADNESILFKDAIYTGRYIHIVGNGKSTSARSNAHTLDWDGNAWFAGSVEGTALILSSPNGTRFNITVGDDGVLSATEITEGGN